MINLQFGFNDGCRGGG